MFQTIAKDEGVTTGVWRCTHREPGWCEGTRLKRGEVVVPLRGAYVQEGSAGEQFACPAVAMLGSPGEEYRVRHPAGGGDRCAVFLFEEEALEDVARATGALAPKGPRFRISSVPVRPDVFLSVHGLLARLSQGQAREPVETSYGLAEILTALLVPVGGRRQDGGEKSPGRLQRRAVLKAQEFMAARSAARLTLAEIANAAGYSPFHFARLFRIVTGTSVHGRLTEIRLRTALHRIQEGAQDLSAVALSSGFSSHSHFGAAFRKAFGIPPSGARTLARTVRDHKSSGSGARRGVGSSGSSWSSTPAPTASAATS